MTREELPPEMVAFCQGHGLVIITLDRYRELREKENAYDAIEAQSEFLWSPDEDEAT